MNELIETIFSGFKVDNQLVPVSFLRYDGNSEAYITYQQVDSDGVIGADDEIINFGNQIVSKKKPFSFFVFN